MAIQEISISPSPPTIRTKSKVKYIELTLLYSIALFAFIAFSSLSAYWVQAPYDGWRIYEIFILIGFSGYLICSNNTQASLFTPKTNKIIVLILILITGLIIYRIYSTQYRQRAIADASLYFLLASGVYTQAILLRKYSSIAPKIAAWLALLPMLTLIFLPIAIYDISHNRPGAWTQSFTNIRMLDDALLPCVFLLWQRPAWLGKKYNKSRLINVLMSMMIYVISVIYILSFLLHGARAGLLAITTALFCLVVLRLNEWRNLLLPINSIIIASIYFFIFSQHQATVSGGSVLIRSGTSERTELWQKAINLWLQHPILGTGGDSFLLNPPYMTQGHPHNITFQFLSEWGLAGILVLLLLIPLMRLIFRKQQILPNFALGAVIALGVNCMLSGSLIYPVSQLLVLWPLAWAISMLPEPSNTIIQYNNNLYKLTPTPILRIFKILAVIAALAILTIHGRDMLCKNCMSADWEGAPRFWDAGRALHLIPYDTNKIGKAPSEL